MRKVAEDAQLQSGAAEVQQHRVKCLVPHCHCHCHCHRRLECQPQIVWQQATAATVIRAMQVGNNNSSKSTATIIGDNGTSNGEVAHNAATVNAMPASLLLLLAVDAAASLSAYNV